MKPESPFEPLGRIEPRAVLPLVEVGTEGRSATVIRAIIGTQALFFGQPYLPVRVVQTEVDEHAYPSWCHVACCSLKVGDVELMLGAGVVSVRSALAVLEGYRVEPGAGVSLVVVNTKAILAELPPLALRVERVVGGRR